LWRGVPSSKVSTLIRLNRLGGLGIGTSVGIAGTRVTSVWLKLAARVKSIRPRSL
jgi:hypothetical protein